MKGIEMKLIKKRQKNKYLSAVYGYELDYSSSCTINPHGNQECLDTHTPPKTCYYLIFDGCVNEY